MARQYQHGIWDVILLYKSREKNDKIFLFQFGSSDTQCLKSKTDVEALLEMLYGNWVMLWSVHSEQSYQDCVFLYAFLQTIDRNVEMLPAVDFNLTVIPDSWMAAEY